MLDLIVNIKHNSEYLYCASVFLRMIALKKTVAIGNVLCYVI